MAGSDTKPCDLCVLICSTEFRQRTSNIGIKHFENSNQLEIGWNSNYFFPTKIAFGWEGICEVIGITESGAYDLLQRHEDGSNYYRKVAPSQMNLVEKVMSESMKDDRDDKHYEVEKILQHRDLPDGNREYKVQWKDYPPSHATWEPKQLLNCPDLVTKYWMEIRTSKSRNARKKNGKQEDDISDINLKRKRESSTKHTTENTKNSELDELDELDEQVNASDDHQQNVHSQTTRSGRKVRKTQKARDRD